MRDWRNKIIGKAMYCEPKYWGMIYFGVIPLFALVYWCMPSDWFGYGSPATNLSRFLDSLYFSTITITTLGFGDVYPIHYGAKIAVIGESLIGILAIGLFLNAVAFKRGEIDAAEEKKRQRAKHIELESIKLWRLYVVTSPYLKDFIDYATIITTPIVNRKGKYRYNPDFEFKDMCDLYLPTLRLCDNNNEPAILHFYKSMHVLETRLETMVANVDFEPWPDLDTKILSALRLFRMYDHESMVLSCVYMRSGDKPMTECISEQIKDWNGPVEFHESNAINGPVALCKMIKEVVPLLEDVNAEIVNISKSIVA